MSTPKEPLPTSKPQFGQARVVGGARPRPVPVKLPIRSADRHVIDAGMPLAHQAVRVEGPVLIAVGSEPGARLVVPLIGEADRDAIVGEGPKLLDQPVLKLMHPFLLQESDDRRTALEELTAV